MIDIFVFLLEAVLVSGMDGTVFRSARLEGGTGQKRRRKFQGLLLGPSSGSFELDRNETGAHEKKTAEAEEYPELADPVVPYRETVRWDDRGPGARVGSRSYRT